MSDSTGRELGAPERCPSTDLEQDLDQLRVSSDGGVEAFLEGRKLDRARETAELASWGAEAPIRQIR